MYIEGEKQCIIVMFNETKSNFQSISHYTKISH